MLLTRQRLSETSSLHSLYSGSAASDLKDRPFDNDWVRTIISCAAGWVLERKLTAILCADVFGHGRLMGGASTTVAVIIRVTGGNFRLLNRLLTQIQRILEINTLNEVTRPLVEAARESLVIGQV